MNKNNQQNNDKKQSKQNSNEVKPQKESKESQLIKQKNDLQLLVDKYKLEIVDKNKKIDDLNNKLNFYANEYKIKISEIEKKANLSVQQKLNEYQLKNKKELEETKKFILEKEALKIIEIVDHLERSCNFQTQDQKINNFLVGFKMILTMAKNLLTSLNIEIISPNKGDAYDSTIMECFETICDNTKKNDTIIEIINKGYKLHSHILKPALVKVIKNSSNK